MARFPLGVVASAAAYEAPPVGGPGGGTGGTTYEDDWTAGSLPSGWAINSGGMAYDGTGARSSADATFAALVRDVAPTEHTVAKRTSMVMVDAVWNVTNGQTYVQIRFKDTFGGTGGTVTSSKLSAGLVNGTGNASFWVNETITSNASAYQMAKPANGLAVLAQTWDNATGKAVTYVLANNAAPVAVERTLATTSDVANQNAMHLDLRGAVAADMKIRKTFFQINSSAVMNLPEISAKATSWGLTVL